MGQKATPAPDGSVSSVVELLTVRRIVRKARADNLRPTVHFPKCDMEVAGLTLCVRDLR